MKYLVLLGLLVGCSVQKLEYKTGDCIRLYGNDSVVDFMVVDMFKDKYVVSIIYKSKNEILKVNRKYVYAHEDFYGRTKKISCEEAE